MSDHHFKKCCEDPDKLSVRIVQLSFGSDRLFQECLGQGLIKDNELSRRLFIRWANRQFDTIDWNRPISQEKMNELLKEIHLSIPMAAQIGEESRSVTMVAALLNFATPTGLDQKNINELQPGIQALFVSKINSVRRHLESI